MGDHRRFRTPTATGVARACRSLLAAPVAVMRRVTLGPPVAGVRFRHPALRAKPTDTVDESSGARRVPGSGVVRIEAEYRAVGAAFEHRAARLAAGIDISQGLLRTDQVDVAGTYDRARECELRPRGPRVGRIR